ncbi:MAG: YmdB family metallophosphoesterase [Deltaproteobacteria bacterium]|jgi:metallophosphoesterase (TIGR00282 family)|nr:YmdB family metallophosphoesterase [Deltaproteobacteria bacterium]
MTRILFLGDIFGKPGRRLVARRLPAVMAALGADMALANGENASGGMGLNPKNARELLGTGLAALSGGNHTFKFPDFHDYLDQEPRLIRPANYPSPCPGKGWTVVETKSGVRVGLGNVMGRVLMGGFLECPFRAADELLRRMAEAGAAVTIIDFHAEATSEKLALGRHLDGRLGALVGTHTHVQTNDAQLMPGGLAYVTDLGLTGSHAGVIGMETKGPLEAFMSGRPARYKPAKGNLVMEGAVVDFDDEGRATGIGCFRQADDDPGAEIEEDDGV